MYYYLLLFRGAWKSQRLSDRWGVRRHNNNNNIIVWHCDGLHHTFFVHAAIIIRNIYIIIIIILSLCNVVLYFPYIYYTLILFFSPTTRPHGVRTRLIIFIFLFFLFRCNIIMTCSRFRCYECETFRKFTMFSRFCWNII